MINKIECNLVANRSDEWQGPNSWGLIEGYRLSLSEAIALPGFG